MREWAAAKRAGLRATMWRAAGIVRRSDELAAALQEVAGLAAEVDAVARSHGVAAPLVELSNLAACAQLVVACALQRRESRGLHCSADFPEEDPAGRPSVVALRDDVAALAGGGGGGGGGGPGGAGGGGAGGSGTRGGAKKKLARPGAAQRDLAVRSTPQDQE